MPIILVRDRHTFKLNSPCAFAFAFLAHFRETAKQTTVVSKWVGDSFNEGLYHTALELKHIPFLELQERRRNRNKSAQDVMTPAGRRNDGLVMFDEKETVLNVLRKLKDNKHNGFPVRFCI